MGTKKGIAGIVSKAKEFVENKLEADYDAAEKSMKNRFDRMKKEVTNKVGISITGTDHILKYKPDIRSISNLSFVMLGAAIICIMPSFFKTLGVMVILFGIVMFYKNYIIRTKIAIPDGYKGIISQWGKYTDKEPKKGRNWFFNLKYYMSFLVSTHEQVISASCSSVTSDFGAMTMESQITWIVSDEKVFCRTITPAGAIRLINLYYRYIGIRIITSMDSRVKFVGTQDMVNIKNALNSYMAQYGVAIIRVNIHRVNNPIIDDLEAIRTLLVAVEQLAPQNKAVKENAIKEVESSIRYEQRNCRTQASNLQQAEVELRTDISGKLNTIIPKFMFEARERLETAKSQLLNDIETYKAKQEKARQIVSSWGGVQTEIDLRIAGLKRQMFFQMMPKKVNIIDVPGMGNVALLDHVSKLFNPEKQEVQDNHKSTISDKDELT